MDTLEMKDIEAAVEGILFASGEPVAVDRICVALNMDRPTVEPAGCMVVECTFQRMPPSVATIIS